MPGNIFCITDPPGANIYLDGTLQTQKTQVTLTGISQANHTVVYSKSGYANTNSTPSPVPVRNNLTVTAGAVLTPISTVTGQGIVICTGSSIATCPLTPLNCPVSISPLDYINLIATINATQINSLTVRFVYTINSIVYSQDVPVTLSIGNNIVYAFPTNIQYPPNTILSLTNVLFI